MLNRVDNLDGSLQLLGFKKGFYSHFNLLDTFVTCHPDVVVLVGTNELDIRLN